MCAVALHITHRQLVAWHGKYCIFNASYCMYPCQRRSFRVCSVSNMDKKANIKTDNVTFRWQKVCISEGSMLEGFLLQSVWQGFVSKAAGGRATDSQTWFPPTQPSKHLHTYSTSCLIALERNGSGPHVHTVDTTSITRALHHEAAAVVYGNVF